MGHCDRLLQNYQRFVRLPWSEHLAGKQRVWFAVYPPSEERRVRAHVQEFQVATIDAGHTWHAADVTDLPARWLANHEYKDGYFTDPVALQAVEEEVRARAVGVLRGALRAPGVDEDTVVAVQGVGALFGFAHAGRTGRLRRRPPIRAARQAARPRHRPPRRLRAAGQPVPWDEAWKHLPANVQRTILDKGLQVHTVNAAKVARKAGLGGRINTVMQACFFALADVMPTDEALDLIKDSARKTYAKRGPEIVQANLDAIDKALAAMTEVVIPDDADVTLLDEAPQVRNGPSVASELATIRRLIAGEGELLPVSAMSPGGTFPTGTAALEKRGLATELPVWESDNCIDCGKCTLACPHAAIRMKAFSPDFLDEAPGRVRVQGIRTRLFRPARS